MDVPLDKRPINRLPPQRIQGLEEEGEDDEWEDVLEEEVAVPAEPAMRRRIEKHQSCEHLSAEMCILLRPLHVTQ